MSTVDFWRGPAGDVYRERNLDAEANSLEARIDLWADILAATGRPQSVAEIGAGAGQNLHALSRLAPNAELVAIEPNAGSRQHIVKAGIVPANAVLDGTAGDIPLDDGEVEMAFTSGVLIHIPPDQLLKACREIHRVAARTIVCIEYFSAAPREVIYRGESGRLWTRDFGSFWLDRFPGLTPVGCGFAWKRTTGLDDLTWWAFEKGD